jgi:hypothetical protein
MKQTLIILTIILGPLTSNAQVNDAEYGAWYMYFFNTTFKDGPWGVQGDIQFRNWNIGGDLEQLLLRGGITYKPINADIKFTAGYGNITTGAYGDDNSTTSESRIYQEALFPTKLGRFHLNHRFRYEQRFVENQDFRTRYRYNLFINVPFNKKGLEKGAVYLALYNELFINGQRDIGNGNQVEIFDRNRLYTGLGYVISKSLRVQLGSMNQTTNSWSKDQLQVSLHHKF